jgi:diguanylate cyclase (GGDEF)-like protein
MSLAAALIYWVIVLMWLMVLGTIIFFYVRNPHTFGTTRLLLAVLCIDTIRNIVENVYFGLYFGSRYEIFPASLAALMGQPVLLIIPKILNVVAGSVVLGLLLFRWFPMAIRERALAHVRATDLEAQATIDFLTGVYNRRHFEALAGVELTRAHRYMRPLSVLMIDVDHFKDVNDRLGHEAGDCVLQNVAALCRAEIGPTDVLARMGGEEFAIMLPETTQHAAAQFAERLRSEIQNSVLTVFDEKVRVTVSIGVAGLFPDAPGTPGTQDLLRRADQALYEAKNGGRNRVSAAPEPELQVIEAAE